MGNFKRLVLKHELPSVGGKTVTIDGKSIAVFKVDDSFYAIDNTCLHMGGPLGEGCLDGGVVTCPWHGWKFDVKTGAGGKPGMNVKSYPVKIEGDHVMAAIS